MRIIATLEGSTLEKLLRQLLPITVIIDDDDGDRDRWIRLDPAHGMALIAGEGLLVEVQGQLRWKTAGVPVLLTITSAQLMLKPIVVDDEHGGRLVFRPSLEHMDLKNIPDFVDSGIVAIVNRRLESQGDNLAWHFGQTLNNSFPLGKELIELATFDLAAGPTSVEVRTDAIVLTTSLVMGFTRRAAD